MKRFETTHLVKSEDLNHHHTLFAAKGSAWFVEAGFVAAAGEKGTTDGLVLRTVNQMSFLRPTRIGEILSFHSQVVYAGTTSLIVAVNAKKMLTGEAVMEGFLTFVTVEEATGKKQPHHIVLDDTQDEVESELRKKALDIRH